MNFKVCTAQEIKLSDMHDAMCDAFSDYDIPMQPSFAQFCDMLKLRQFKPELSTIILAEGVVQSFWLIGTKGNRGHLIMSGTRPGARGNGYAHQLGSKAEILMKVAGITSIEFEVLTTNKKAISLYEKTGHKQNRVFDCFKFESPSYKRTTPFNISAIAFSEIADEVATFKDFSPSWQASNTAINAAGDNVSCMIAKLNNQIVGFLVASSNGSILQLAVAQKHRRNGIATKLLAESSTANEIKNLTYVNVDSRDLSTTAFIQKLGGQKFAQQFEMSKQL